MLDTSNLSKFLKGITDAIRAKKGTTEPIEHKLIDEEIASIQSGNPYQILQDRFFYSGRTNYQYAFMNSKITYDDLSNLVLDTSNSTNFSDMFNACGALTTIPLIDTSNGTNFSNMFRNCGNLTTIPQLNISNSSSLMDMFTNCTNLTTIPQLDTSKCNNFNSMFARCTNLITIPQLDTSNGMNFDYMFLNCSNLTTISQLDTSKGTNFNNMFTNCYALENIVFVAKCIKKSIWFTQSDKLTDESIQSIIDGLADLTGQTAQTITFHPNVKNKLTKEQIASATSKNWNIA